MRSAIDRMLSKLRVDQMRTEFALVGDFADKSEDVHVTIDQTYFDFLGSKPLDSILLAYFIAGAVEFDLEHPTRARDPQADVGAAIRAALIYYRAHRLAHPDVTHPLFERFDLLEKQGALDRFISDRAPAAAE